MSDWRRAASLKHEKCRQKGTIFLTSGKWSMIVNYSNTDSYISDWRWMASKKHEKWRQQGTIFLTSGKCSRVVRPLK